MWRHFVVLIVLSLHANASASIDTFIPSSNIINNNDSSTARRILTLIQSKSYKEKKRELQRLKYLTSKKSNAFKSLNPGITVLLKCIKNSSKCNTIPKGPSHLRFITNAMTRIRNEKILNQLIKNPTKISLLKKLFTDGKFLRNKRTYYLFSKFVDVGLKKEGALKFSNRLAKLMVEKNIMLPTKIITKLNINKETTDYLQGKYTNSHSEVSILTKEFVSQYKSILSKIENKKSWNESLEYLLGFHFENQKFISYPTSIAKLTYLGKRLLSIKEDAKASKIFEYLLSISKGDDIDSSLFLILTPAITSNNYQMAQGLIDKYQLMKKFGSISTQLRFWIAYTAEKNGNTPIAKHLYKTLIQLDPISYYSSISLGKLKENNSKVLSRSIATKNDIQISFSQLGENAQSLVRQFLCWSELSHFKLTWSTLKAILYLSNEETIVDKNIASKFSHREISQQIVSSVIQYLSGKNKHLHSFKLITHAMNKNFKVTEQTIENLFPLMYMNEIEQNSDTVDPHFVLSLIRQESAFNPKARSHVGARGLMQLMPKTAKDLNNKVKTKDLSNPNTNIKLGIKYLEKLLSKYDGNMIYALSAYNAGENRVKKWNNSFFKLSNDPLVKVELIPFSETRKYVKLIYRNLYYYKHLTNTDMISFKSSALVK